jgi:hypothetical protein
VHSPSEIEQRRDKMINMFFWLSCVPGVFVAYQIGNFVTSWGFRRKGTAFLSFVGFAITIFVTWVFLMWVAELFFEWLYNYKARITEYSGDNKQK